MITRVTIQGFKSLQDVQVDLGRVNVFVGANGSGKTNLLEAIGFLSAATGRQVDVEALLKRKVDRGLTQVDDQDLLRRGARPGVISLFHSSFKEPVPLPNGITIRAEWPWEDGLAGYQVEAGRDTGDIREQPWPVEESFKFNRQDLQLRPTKDGHRAVYPPVEAFDLVSILRDYAIFDPNTPTLRGKVGDPTPRPPVGLEGGRLAEAVDELLDTEGQRFGHLELEDLLELLDWVDDIVVEAPSPQIVSPSVPTTRHIIRFTDRWMHADRNQLSAHDVSEGALYVLFALVLALHPKSPRLFGIDNLYQTMHPRLARATTRLFCQQMLAIDPPRQALLTTHNPLVLDGLDLRDDRIRLFAVERDSRGATQVHRVRVSEEVLEATQEGLSLSNLWVMGRLGGVPDLF